jgi:hypothetical protein
MGRPDVAWSDTRAEIILETLQAIYLATAAMIVGMIALEHAVISDGKENHDEHRAHREKRVLEHPVERRFKNIATGELEPFAKSISQIHGSFHRSSTIMRNLKCST